jgi:hypothetical protein
VYFECYGASVIELEQLPGGSMLGLNALRGGIFYVPGDGTLIYLVLRSPRKNGAK